MFDSWSRCSAAVLSGLLAILVLIQASTAAAWDVVLPNATARTLSGLTVKVDSRWVSGHGYRPVRVFVGPLGGVARADRTVTVRLSLQAYPRRVSAERTIELPQGSRGVIETIAVPLSTQWYSSGLQVTESGQVLPDLTVDHFPIFNAGAYGQYQAASFLFIDADTPRAKQRGPGMRAGLPGVLSNSSAGGNVSKPGKHNLPDVHVLTQPFYEGSVPRSIPAATSGVDEGRFEDRDIMRVVENASCLEMLPPEELPNRWIELTAFDLIFINWTDLNATTLGYPDRWHAIQEWVIAGGTLVVCGAGADRARLEQLGKLIGIASPTPAGYWEKPPIKRFGKHLQGLENADGYYGPGIGITATATPSNPKKGKKPAKRNKPDLDFQMCDLGMGKVVAIKSADPFPGRPLEWAWFLNTLHKNRWQWEKRHGMSPLRDNPDMWALLVPGVGTPPVGAFLVLISIFILLAGPVNYLVLRRYKRLYLLLVTVPAAAAVVTTGVFAYAVLADGLGVKVRLRSITLLDQRRGQAISWSRQTYYAALVPSGGLVFPDTAAVYPVLPDAGRSRSWSSTWELAWQSDQQRLVRGYIWSRIPAQFLVIQPSASTAQLAIQSASDDRAGEGQNSIDRVTNQLGTRVNQVLLRAADRTLYWAENIESGAGVKPEPIEAAVATKHLSPLFNANRPALPPGFDPANNRSFFSGGLRVFGRWGGPTPGFASSLMEVRLREASAAPTQLPPHTYVAIVDAPPQVPIGVKKAEHLACFHVIIGRW